MDSMQSSKDISRKSGDEWESVKSQYESMLTELMDEQTGLINKISQLTNMGESAKTEIEALSNLTKSLETQRKMANEKLKFSNLVIKIMKGKFNGGGCDQVHDRVMEELKLMDGDFFVLIYHGNFGGENWGYCTSVIDSNFYCHEWNGGYCYVVSKIKRNGTSLNESQLANKVNSLYSTDGDCIERASKIYDGLCNDGNRPCFALCKKSPGGFENFCYNLTCGAVGYHSWHDIKNFFGFTTSSYCVGVRV